MVLIGCGLSLEEVAGVDQEGPPGEGIVMLGLKRLQSSSNEGVTCVVLIGCGLSIEGVAGVDQEGPPGERDAKAGFEEVTELFK